MLDLNDPFAGIDDAPPSEGGQYIKPGLHKLKVKKVSVVPSQRKRDKAFFVAEMIVLETDNEAEMKVGSTRSWVVDFSWETALSNIRGFVAAACDCEFEEITREDCNGACSEANPLKGVVMGCEAFNLKTRAEKDFTKCKWSFVSEPVEGDEDEDADEGDEE